MKTKNLAVFVLVVSQFSILSQPPTLSVQTDSSDGKKRILGICDLTLHWIIRISEAADRLGGLLVQFLPRKSW